MLKYQSTGDRHTTSSPIINSAIFMARFTPSTLKPHLPSEKDQIQSIRHISKILYEDQSDSTVTFE
jgi:hypothetical protein